MASFVGWEVSPPSNFPQWVDSAGVTHAISSTFFSVTDYGATGNGTTDDTAAIQACLSAAAFAGARVWFEQGTYKVTATLNVTGGTLEIWGSNGSVVSAGAGIGTVFSFAGVAYPRIYGLTVTHTTTTHTDVTFATDTCIFPEYNHVVVNNCYVAWQIGGSTGGNDGFTLDTCWAFANVNGSVVKHLTGNGVVLNNVRGTGQNVFVAGSATSASIGYQFPTAAHTDTVFLFQCQFLGFYRNMECIPGSSFNVIDVWMLNCNFDRSQQESVYIAPASGSEGVGGWYVGDTYIHSDNAVGLYLACVTNGTIFDLQFHNLNVSSCGTHGVYISGQAASNIFNNCRISGNGQNAANTYDAVHVAASSAGYSFYGSTLEGNVGGNQTANGFNIGNNCNRINVFGGKATGMASYGFVWGTPLSDVIFSDFDVADSNAAGAASFAGALQNYGPGGNVIRNCRGLNPYGYLSGTGPPTSGTAQAAEYPFDCVLIITAASGGCTIAYTGLGSATAVSFTIAAGASFPLQMPAGGSSYTLTYTTAPTVAVQAL